MTFERWFSVEKQKPSCIGTGLVALDIVVGQESVNSPELWAGGSCGNVLTILAYLGWGTYPIARLKNDAAAKKIVSDMGQWGVNTSFIYLSESGSTPIIVERIRVGKNGIPRHRFEWNCPNCGSGLPRYKPVLVKDVQSISVNLPKSQVFYFDRVVRSSVELAKECRERGALIVFEPSSIKDEKMFRECLQVSDIVKYSSERLHDISEITDGIGIPLEIETLGVEGLRYRFNKTKDGCWNLKPSYSVTEYKDSAGAGDWCTAGIIHLLGQNGISGFNKSQKHQIEEALSFGQVLATINLCFEGARGGMYKMSPKAFKDNVRNIWNGLTACDKKEFEELYDSVPVLDCFCPNCTKKMQTNNQ